MPTKKFKSSKIAGYCIYYDDLLMTGLPHYRRNWDKYIKQNSAEIELHRDPDNQIDPNALVCSFEAKTLFGRKLLRLGFVDAHTAKDIRDKGIFDFLILRPKKIFLGTNENNQTVFSYYLIGPEEQYEKFFS